MNQMHEKPVPVPRQRIAEMTDEELERFMAGVDHDVRSGQWINATD